MQPRHTIPVLPVLSGWRDFGPARGIPGILDAGKPLWLRSGSAAIALALRQAPISPGDEVLVPAFNCPTMVTPIHFVGATPVFYRITEKLDLSTQDITAKLSPRTRAVLAPHLFGRLQDLQPLRQLCDQRGILLIEDCAHLFFGVTGGRPAGSTGHFAIASPRKFFPLAEGGLLVSRDRKVQPGPLPLPGAKQSLRNVFDVIDLAVQADRLPWAAVLVRGAKRVAGGSRAAPAPSAAPATVAQTPAPVMEQAAQSTRRLAGSYSHEWVARRRRENFAVIRDRVRSLRHVEFLDVQDSNAIPYMAPVILSDPARQFAELKARGMPMWRWEDSMRGICDVTDRYSQSLIQLPCHQSLSGGEIETMLDILSTTR